MLFSFFRIRSISNLEFRRYNPVFRTYMITINSIHHLHFCHPDSTLHGLQTIFNKMSLKIADMYMSVMQYFQNMQRAFVGARPQLRIIGSFCYESSN